MSKQSSLTLQDIEAGYENAAWLGFGYLGERRHALTEYDDSPASPDRVAFADAIVLQEAEARKMSRDRLFRWLNSREGRHFGDLVFGGWPDEQVVKHTASYFNGF